MAVFDRLKAVLMSLGKAVRTQSQKNESTVATAPDLSDAEETTVAVDDNSVEETVELEASVGNEGVQATAPSVTHQERVAKVDEKHIEKMINLLYDDLDVLLDKIEPWEKIEKDGTQTPISRKQFQNHQVQPKIIVTNAADINWSQVKGDCEAFQKSRNGIITLIAQESNDENNKDITASVAQDLTDRLDEANKILDQVQSRAERNISQDQWKKTKENAKHILGAPVRLAEKTAKSLNQFATEVGLKTGLTGKWASVKASANNCCSAIVNWASNCLKKVTGGASRAARVCKETLGGVWVKYKAGKAFDETVKGERKEAQKQAVKTFFSQNQKEPEAAPLKSEQSPSKSGS